jgi:hypothetical protein
MSRLLSTIALLVFSLTQSSKVCQSSQLCGFNTTEYFTAGDCTFSSVSCDSYPSGVYPIDGCLFTQNSLNVKPYQSVYFDSSRKRQCVNATFSSVKFQVPDGENQTSVGIQTFQGSKFVTTVTTTLFVEYDFGFTCGSGIIKFSCKKKTNNCTINNISVIFYATLK